MEDRQIIIDFRLSEASRREINQRLYRMYHTLNRAHMRNIDHLLEVEVQQTVLEAEQT